MIQFFKSLLARVFPSLGTTTTASRSEGWTLTTGQASRNTGKDRYEIRCKWTHPTKQPIFGFFVGPTIADAQAAIDKADQNSRLA